MRYTIDTVTGLCQAVADALIGRASVEELRRASVGAKRAGRITRRHGDAEIKGRIAAWPMTIVDVLPAMGEREAYAQRVSRWAQSVIDSLEAQHPRP
jgi:hypothetical protein